LAIKEAVPWQLDRRAQVVLPDLDPTAVPGEAGKQQEGQQQKKPTQCWLDCLTPSPELLVGHWQGRW